MARHESGQRAPSLQGARRDAFLAAGVSVRSAAKGNETGAGMRVRFTQPLYVLLAIALLVLVIACFNLASLMVARGAAAGHDMGVRMALGAARLRVMRAVVVEGVLLAIGGGFFECSPRSTSSRASNRSQACSGRYRELEASRRRRRWWRARSKAYARRSCPTPT